MQVLRIREFGNEELRSKHNNKKFLETDYPRGRAIEVFRRFHFGLGGQKSKFSILPHPELQKGSSDLSKGEVNRKPRGKAVGELFRFKIQHSTFHFPLSSLHFQHSTFNI